MENKHTRGENAAMVLVYGLALLIGLWMIVSMVKCSTKRAGESWKDGPANRQNRLPGSTGFGGIIEVPLPAQRPGVEAYSQAGGYRQMLGRAFEREVQITPRFHIKVQTNDFDSPRWKHERRSEEWLRGLGVHERFITSSGETVMPSLREFSQDIWSSRSRLLEIVDERWAKRVESWSSCGEPWRSRVLRVDASQLSVRVEATVFYVAEVGQWRGEWAHNEREVSAIIFYTQNAITNPVDAWNKSFGNELEWALGNLLARRYGMFDPMRPVGSWKPCQLPYGVTWAERKEQ